MHSTMPAQRTSVRRLRLLALVLGPLSVAACLAAGCMHMLPEASLLDHAETCRSVSKAARNHVYIFLLDAFDPTGCGELTELRNVLNELGFIQTYSGQAYHACSFSTEMKKIYKTDKDACFVLIGTAWSRDELTGLIKLAQDEKMPLRLIVRFYCDPRIVPCPRPKKDLAVWNLRWGPNKETLQKLTLELALLSANVPVPAPALPKLPSELAAPKLPTTPVPPDVEIAPQPRPVPFMPPADEDDGWDALNPLRHLRQLPNLKVINGPKKPEKETNSEKDGKTEKQSK